ncbi:fatty acid synthase alpha subunit Lsd1, partial [Mycoemilia scoparia]
SPTTESTDAEVDFTRQILESLATKQQIESANGADGTQQGVGVDVELVSAINTGNTTFIERNFTPAEIEYCSRQPDPQSSFAGKWCAKEAVVKAVSSLNIQSEKVWTKGAAAPLNEIEVISGPSGAPEITFYGDAKAAVSKAGAQDVKVSISHSGNYAVAVAIAK